MGHGPTQPSWETFLLSRLLLRVRECSLSISTMARIQLSQQVHPTLQQALFLTATPHMLDMTELPLFSCGELQCELECVSSLAVAAVC